MPEALQHSLWLQGTAATVMTAVAATATAQAATVAVALQCVQLAGRDGHTLRSQTGRLGRAEPSQLLGRRPCSQTGLGRAESALLLGQ